MICKSSSRPSRMSEGNTNSPSKSSRASIGVSKASIQQNWDHTGHPVDPYVCSTCDKRYASSSGLSYHINKFNHSDSPKNYNSMVPSKRGRPKGYRSIESGKLARISLPSSPIVLSSPKTPRRLNRTMGGNESKTSTHVNRKLTYEESQRLVDVEIQGVFHRIPIDDNLEVFYDGSTLDMSHAQTPKRHENVPIPEFTINKPYQNKLKEINMPDEYFHPLKNCEMFMDCTEYQMDEEDIAYLEILKAENECFNRVTPENFQYVMDRLEKESEYVVKTADGSLPHTTDEDVVCAVCLDGDCSNNNAIVFCDICNIAVHQDCYGVPFVPEGSWICRRCSNAPSMEVECVICPVKGGVLKQTNDGAWCHIICAILVPGAKFTNSAFLDAIDVSEISPTRLNVQCKICQKSEGAVIQCYQHQCTVAFHPSCAQINGWLAVERTETPGADEHTPAQITHRYLAFCDKHLPTTQQVKETTKNSTTRIRIIQPIQHKSTFIPEAIHVPAVSDKLLKDLSQSIKVNQPQLFVSFVKRYWQIKRYMRSGVPILRRRSYVPRNLPSSIKINLGEMIQPQFVESTVEKLKALKKYITGFVELLELCKEREALRLKLDLLQKSMLNNLFNPDLFLAEFENFASNCMKEDSVNIDKRILMTIMCKNFDSEVFVGEDNFENFISNVINDYCTEIQLRSNIREKMIILAQEFIKTQHIKKSTPKKHSPGKVSPRKRKSTTRFSISPKIEIIPSNPELEPAIKKMTADLKNVHSHSEVQEYLNTLEGNSLVWGPFDKVKYFPAFVVDNGSSKHSKSKSITVTFFDNKNTQRQVSRRSLTPLGLSANIDEGCLATVINSKSYDRKIKRSVLDSYSRARSITECNEPFNDED